MGLAPWVWAALALVVAATDGTNEEDAVARTVAEDALAARLRASEEEGGEAAGGETAGGGAAEISSDGEVFDGTGPQVLPDGLEVSPAGRVSMALDARGVSFGEMGEPADPTELFQAEAAAGLAALAETSVTIAGGDAPVPPGTGEDPAAGESASGDIEAAGEDLREPVEGGAPIVGPESCELYIEACYQKCDTRFQRRIYDVSMQLKAIAWIPGTGPDAVRTRASIIDQAVGEGSSVFCAIQMCMEKQCNQQKCVEARASPGTVTTESDSEPRHTEECNKVEAKRYHTLKEMVQAMSKAIHDDKNKEQPKELLPSCKSMCGPKRMSWKDFLNGGPSFAVVSSFALLFYTL